MSSHADTIRESLHQLRAHLTETCPSCEGAQTRGLEALDALLAERQQLREIVENYSEHGSWRCQYRTRCKACLCGLDERLAALGLPPCGFDDPEAALARVEKSE